MHVKVRVEMISIEVQYFSVSKNLLLAIGLWPYQRTRLAQFQYIFFFSILLTAIVCHFTTFITTQCTLHLVIKILSSVFIFIDVAVEYMTFRMHSLTVKMVLEELQRLCGEMKDKNELDIIKKYGIVSKRYAIGLTALVICAELGLILTQLRSSIFDYVQPRNESRPRTLVFPMEYFVDTQRYFFLLMLHTDVAVCIGATVLLATGTVFISCQKCICGMFMIASYHIEHSMKFDALQEINPSNRDLIFLRIVRAVEIHQRAMKFCQSLVSKFELMFAVLIMAGVSSLSLNLFRIVLILSSTYNIEELLLPIGLTAAITSYMFLSNYIGQDITDHNRQIFISAYNIHWYEAPLNVQKLILFLLQQGIKDFTVNIGGMIAVSLECFATEKKIVYMLKYVDISLADIKQNMFVLQLTNMSISYFTVLYSTQ